MARNLDLTALRSFVAVADSGGVTRAAGFLNLTQSAVSMQLKRLEEMLGLQLLDRSARTIALTPSGEQLLGYARRMLEVNDEIFARLTAQEFEGAITLCVPHDIVYPNIPQVLHQFHAAYPRMRVQLVSSFTSELKEQFKRGEADLILTTEDALDRGGETLAVLPLLWVGASGGSAWKNRPLPLAFESRCRFRPTAHKALDDAGIAWTSAFESNQTRTIEAAVSADLAVHAMLEGTHNTFSEAIPHGGALPQLGSQLINMYVSTVSTSTVLDDLAQMVRGAFRTTTRSDPKLALAGA